jgi:hypothetical protein
MNIKVNSTEWSGISDADRKKIQDITDSFFKAQHTFVPVEGARATEAIAANPFCTAACSIAEAAAVAACAALSGPAIPICIAAAHAAGQLCRDRC